MPHARASRPLGVVCSSIEVLIFIFASRRRSRARGCRRRVRAGARNRRRCPGLRSGPQAHAGLRAAAWAVRGAFCVAPGSRPRLDHMRAAVAAERASVATAPRRRSLPARYPAGRAAAGRRHCESAFAARASTSRCAGLLEPLCHPAPAGLPAWPGCCVDGSSVQLELAGRHIDRPHLDAMAARILHQLRRRVEAHRLAVRAAPPGSSRLVALEPAAHIHQQREAGGMAFGKAVFAEALDLLEDVLGEFAS